MCLVNRLLHRGVLLSSDAPKLTPSHLLRCLPLLHPGLRPAGTSDGMAAAREAQWRTFHHLAGPPR
eukprot:scaffold1330_cov240-Pinguiococcus_pyrenoidosus.AAC.14